MSRHKAHRNYRGNKKNARKRHVQKKGKGKRR
jgi:hypothetical protein